MKKTLYLFILLLILGVIFMTIVGRQQKRDRFLIPEGYVGWVVVHFSVPGAAALDMEEGFRLIKIDSNGEAFTSSALIPGEGYYDEYFYVTADGIRRRVPNSYFGAGGGTEGTLDAGQAYKSICSFIWIGTKEQYEKMGRPDLDKKC